MGARGLGGILALAAIFLGAAQPAQATDNMTVHHWHDRSPVFNLHTVWSADWRRSLEGAAGTWATTGGLWFRRGPDVNHTNLDDTASHIVMPGSIPTAWRDSCPQATSLACTFVRPGGHLTDGDVVFNTVAFKFQENAADCLLPGTGHIAGTAYDIRTVALHEFGHWGHLTHTTDGGSAMHTFYNGCHKSISTHDNQSMNTLYWNAGHPAGLQVRLGEDELRDGADVVVRGTVVSEDVVPFQANRAVPESAQADPLYRDGAFHDVRVRVDEYVKGDGPSVVSVRRRRLDAPAPGGDAAPAPRAGEQYTLYLDTGRGVWQGGYLLLGDQGLKPR